LKDDEVDEELEKEKKEEKDRIGKIIENLNNEDCFSKKQAMFSIITNMQNIKLMTSSNNNETQTMSEIKFSIVRENFDEEWYEFLKSEGCGIEWDFVRKVDNLIKAFNSFGLDSNYGKSILKNINLIYHTYLIDEEGKYKNILNISNYDYEGILYFKIYKNAKIHFKMIQQPLIYF
jgi:hypothetical protein